MPIQTAKPYTVIFTIQDEKGGVSRMSVYVPQYTFDVGDVALTIEPPDDVRLYAQEIALALDSIITGRIVNISINTPVDLPPGLKAVPDITSDVEEGVYVTYQTTAGRRARFGHRIPTALETVTKQPSGVGLNLANPDVVNFFSLLTNAIEMPAEWTVNACDARGNALVTVRTAKDQFKSLRQRGR